MRFYETRARHDCYFSVGRKIHGDTFYDHRRLCAASRATLMRGLTLYRAPDTPNDDTPLDHRRSFSARLNELRAYLDFSLRENQARPVVEIKSSALPQRRKPPDLATAAARSSRDSACKCARRTVSSSHKVSILLRPNGDRALYFPSGLRTSLGNCRDFSKKSARGRLLLSINRKKLFLSIARARVCMGV